MTTINKIIPQDLKAESSYAVRVRSVNRFGTTSDYSPTLRIDTSAAALENARRLVITNDGMVAYNSAGQITFNYSGSSIAAIRTNLVRNPSFELGTVGYVALPNSAILRTVVDYFVGEPATLASCKVFASAAGVNIGIVHDVSDVARRMSATGGLAYTATAYIKLPILTPPLVLSSLSMKIGLRFYDAGATLISELVPANPSLITSNGWTRISNVGMIAPAGSVYMGVVIYDTTNMPINTYYYVDGIMVEQTSILRDYFDGSSSVGTSSWVVSASPHDSASILDTSGVYAVNGGTFTQSIIQTSRTIGAGTNGNGVKLTSLGLGVYAPDGTRTFFADALTGVVTISAYTPAGTAIPIGGAASDITTNSTTITGGNVRTGSIQSATLTGTTNGTTYTTSGMKINLDGAGYITSPQFYIDSSGNAFFKGALSAASGTFAGSLTAASGTFAGVITSGSISIGHALNGVTTFDGIDLESNGNYYNAWLRRSAAGSPANTTYFRVGDSTHYIVMDTGSSTYNLVWPASSIDNSGTMTITGASASIILGLVSGNAKLQFSGSGYSAGAAITSTHGVNISTSTGVAITGSPGAGSPVLYVSGGNADVHFVGSGGTFYCDYNARFSGDVYVLGGGNNRFSDSTLTNWFTPRDSNGNMHILASGGTTNMYLDAANHYFRNAGGGGKMTLDSSANLSVNGVYTNYVQSNGTGYIASNLSVYGVIYGGGNTSGGVSGGSGAVLRSDTNGNNIHFDWNGGSLVVYVDSTAVFVVGSGAWITGGGPKTFVIDHPVDENKYLVHACAEGPTSDVFYRGEGQLVDGVCEITLPEYFEALTELQGRTVQITPIVNSEELTACVAAGRIVNGKFRVVMLAGYINNSQEFYWRVDAIRKNTAFEVEPNKSDVTIAGDGPYTYVAS